MKNLYEKVLEHVEKNMSSFHTPGHKGVKIFNENICNIDLTELPDTDSLYEADGILYESEKRASNLFKTKRSLISSGGNTLCIQTMIRLATMDKRPLISGRNVHRSAVSSMILLDIQPEWTISSEYSGLGLPGRINSLDIASKIDRVGEKCAVYITSPDYYGILSDIKAISEECRKRDSLLLVDNAHGTHLKFINPSLHPIGLGATMSADSAHKTLPVLTGGAWLHIADSNLAVHAKEAMSLFGSTSPSYPIMCSLDLCIKYLQEKGEKDFISLCQKVQKIKNIAKSKNIFMPSGLCDPTRITLMASSIGYSGFELANYLRANKIEPEFCDENYVVLIPSPFNSEKDWNRLEKALFSLKVNKINDFSPKNYRYSLPKADMTLREAYMSEHIKINVKNALGRVAGEIVCPCPPGVPVVMPGEIIGEYEKDAIIAYGISEIYVVK